MVINPVRKWSVFLAGMLCGAALAAVPAVFAAGDATAKTAAPLPWQQVQLLADVMQLVKQDYVEPVDDKTLINNAIRGMLAGLDPHSAFLDKNDYQQMQIITTGDFGGVGLEVGMQDGQVVVISPIDGTPAARAGIRAGDAILKVNGTALDGMSLDDAVNLMRGRAGTRVTLTILHAGGNTPQDLTLTRSDVHVASVSSHLLTPGYGYVRISQFADDSGAGVTQAVAALDKQNGAPLQGLVLDLRDNPGGLLDAAVAVSDDFLNSGIVVSAKGRAPDSNFVRRATPGDVLNGAPMVVLVNGGTASAAEITAGALKDNHRALILGTQTFGKGSVQTVIPLDDGGAIKLTTSLYYTPSGHSIQAEGITPDIVVPALTVAAAAPDQTLKEVNLQGHLANNSPTPESAAGGSRQLATQDFQLYQALNVLKAVSVARQGSAGG